MMRISCIIAILILFVGLSHGSILMIKTDIMQGYSLLYSSEGFQKVWVFTPGYQCSNCIKTTQTIMSQLQSISLLKQIVIYWIDGSNITNQNQVKIYSWENIILGTLTDPSFNQKALRQLIRKQITDQQNGKYKKMDVNGYTVQLLENSEVFLQKYEQKNNERKRLLKMQEQLTQKRIKNIQQDHEIPKINTNTPIYEPIPKNSIHQGNDNTIMNEAVKQNNPKQVINSTNSMEVYYLMLIGLLFIILTVSTIIYRAYCKQDPFVMLQNQDNDN